MSDRDFQPLDPIWHVAFPVYYVLVSGYGLVVAASPLPSLVDVNGFSYAVWWGLVLAVVSFATSRATIYRGGGDRVQPGTHRAQSWTEAVLTTSLISMLLGYGYAVLIATFSLGEHDRLAGAVLPILLCWFPAVKVLAIIRSGRLRPQEH